MVAVRKEENLLRDSGRDGGSDSALAGRDAGEMAHVSPAGQTVAGYLETVGGHPEAELVQDVDGGVDGASDGGAMPFPFAVVFAFGHVNGSGAVKARHAVAGVAVEPGVARLQGHAFRDP